jgi:16S rRNA G966 N2-methylase RsmD
MNGATYMADLTGGQKTGLFYDQRPNHAFAQRLARGARVLDVFSHVGGFGLAALAAGADHALCVDGSQPALDLAAQGAEAGGVAARFSARKGDAFDVMTALAEEGARFDVVVCDPPAFAPSKQALEAGLRAYERVARLAAGLVAEGGYLGLCSCSHAADLAKFRQASTRGIGRAEVRLQPGQEARFWLPDPADVHVLAAAVVGHADVIVTANAKDFPQNVLGEEGLSRADPDNFLLGFLQAHPGPVTQVAEGVLAEARRLSGEAWTMRGLMKKARMPRLGKALS